jgi:hypothetical protein
LTNAPTATLDWPVPKAEWKVYHRVLKEANRAEIPFALGGAIALGAYTGKFRNTKDIDLYVLEADRDRMIKLLNRLGLKDYFDTCPYDRGWIYRASDGKVIVDIIWAMANKRANVDEEWLSRGAELMAGDIKVRVLAPEELIWSKLYVIQRERCDWPDILNVMYSAGPSMDWDHLMQRVGDDAPLLKGVLSVFTWLCPEAKNGSRDEADAVRAHLLDSRPWFNQTGAAPTSERAM